MIAQKKTVRRAFSRAVEWEESDVGRRKDGIIVGTLVWPVPLRQMPHADHGRCVPQKRGGIHANELARCDRRRRGQTGSAIREPLATKRSSAKPRDVTQRVSGRRIKNEHKERQVMNLRRMPAQNRQSLLWGYAAHLRCLHGNARDAP